MLAIAFLWFDDRCRAMIWEVPKTVMSWFAVFTKGSEDDRKDKRIAEDELTKLPSIHDPSSASQ